jgi:hypothetical protein
MSAKGGEQIVPLGTPTVLKITSTEHSKYAINYEYVHFDDISARELFG